MPNWRGNISWVSRHRKPPPKPPRSRRNRKQHVRQRLRRWQNQPRLHPRLGPRLRQRQLRLFHPELLDLRSQPQLHLKRHLHQLRPRHARRGPWLLRRQCIPPSQSRELLPRPRLRQAPHRGDRRFRVRRRDNRAFPQHCGPLQLVLRGARPARRDRQALRRRARDFRFVRAKEAIQVAQVLPKGCVPRRRLVSPGREARRDQAAHLPPDTRSGQAEAGDAPRKDPLAARDRALLEEFPRLSPESHCMHASRPRRAVVRRWTSDMPRASAGFIRCERVQVLEPDARHTWSRWPQSSASRGH